MRWLGPRGGGAGRLARVLGPASLVVLGCACGARSEVEGPADGGAGGDGSAGGSGSAGGGGDAATTCVLTQLPGEIGLAGGESLAQRAPRLQDLGVDVFLARLEQEEATGRERAGLAWFAWDDAWPPSVPDRQLGPLCQTYVTSEALALIADPEGTPLFASLSSPEPLLQLAVGRGSPSFLVRPGDTTTWLAGFTIDADSQLYVSRITPNLEATFDLDWGCGATPVRAAAIPWQGDVLVALTTGADFGGCGIPGGAAPATRLQIARFTESLEGELLYEVDLGASVDSLSLVPRDEGAWLALRTAEAGAAAIEVYRLDAEGRPISAPTAIDPLSSGPFSAGVAGERLAVSYRNQVTNRLTLQLVESDGSLGAAAVLDSADGGEQSSVVGRDDTVLVAYTNAATPSQVRVARFECVAP